jgi:hypothetical protein
MHDWGEVASDGLAAIFRGAEVSFVRFQFSQSGEREQGLSNGARARRSQCAGFE